MSKCLDLASQSSEGKAWHLDQTTRICKWRRSSISWAPMFSSLCIQLCHCPTRTSVPESETTFVPSQGKILLGQARYWGLQHPSQPLYLHLRAFEQMNVNFTSNITGVKQTSLGNWLGVFFSSVPVRYCDWISEDICSSAFLQRNSLMALLVIWPMQCWLTFVRVLPTNWTVVVKLPVT